MRNTGQLERSESWRKIWSGSKSKAMPFQNLLLGITYALYLKELSVKDTQAFLCYFYNVYLAHSAGGRIIGKKVVEMIIIKKELKIYKWDGDLSQLLQNVREKLNEVTEGGEELIAWKEQKNHSSTRDRSCD